MGDDREELDAVATSTRGTRGGPAGRDGYRRRNLLPAALLVMVLAVASILTWIVVFANSTATSVTSCNPSPVGGGTVEAPNALDDQTAAAPGDVRVTVLNGAGQRGQAQLAAVELGELGISEAAPPDNDRLYPAQDLSCVGQIRYGPASAPAARTLSLVVPCAQLVTDGRTENTVDLALGSEFRDITPGQPVSDALRALARRAASDTPQAGTDAATLNALRAVDCSS